MILDGSFLLGMFILLLFRQPLADMDELDFQKKKIAGISGDFFNYLLQELSSLFQSTASCHFLR